MLTAAPEDCLQVIHHLCQEMTGNAVRITDIASQRGYGDAHDPQAGDAQESRPGQPDGPFSATPN